MPRLIGHLEDRGAARRAAGQEASSQRVTSKLLGIESGPLGVRLHDVGNAAVGQNHPPHLLGHRWQTARLRSSSKPTSGKFTSSSGWRGNRCEVNGLGREPGLPRRATSSEVAVKNGRWVLTHLPAKPPEPKPVLHYFPDD